MAPDLSRYSDARRYALMKTCAHATLDEMKEALDGLRPLPQFTDLRPPEVGMVMLRGRMGGDGARFNVGEATVSRAAIRLETGEVGHSYILGRAVDRARHAAIIDALGQRESYRDRIDALLVRPVSSRIAHAADVARRRTAATRVDFFTLVRGED